MNIASLMTQRGLSKTTAELGRSFERLSSGLRINRASDDAAGLAIAVGLEVDARLAAQARRNVNDGLSVTAVISSALEEQQKILLRMSELAEQSANGTLQDTQREALQQEYTALITEFDRIAETTQFNGVSVLKITGNDISIMVGSSGEQASLIGIPAINSTSYSGVLGQISDFDQDGFVGISDFDLFDGVFQITQNDIDTQGLNEKINFGKVEFTDSTGRQGVLSFLIHRIYGDFGQLTPLPSEPSSLELLSSAESVGGEISGATLTSLSLDASSVVINVSYDSGATASVEIDISGLEYQSYDAGGTVRETAIGFTNISIPTFAKNSLETIRNRSEDLSLLQAQVGAAESRLQVAANQLATTEQALREAESRIRDLDIASEVARLTALQIQQQAATAVLAQANQQPQLVLELLA